MKTPDRSRARQRLDQRLSQIDRNSFSAPPKGWVRAIRDAIGMTGAQLANRLHVSGAQIVDALEKSEATGTIQLDTLRRAAQAMDCTLVYALVPKTSLEEMVHQRARKIAVEDLRRVHHTMKLEDQEVENTDVQSRADAYARDHVKLRDLWRKS